MKTENAENSEALAINITINPTKEMIEAGAQGIVSWEDGCVWPDSWDAITVASARNTAERAWRSMYAEAATQQLQSESAARLKLDWAVALADLIRIYLKQAHQLTSGDASRLLTCLINHTDDLAQQIQALTPPAEEPQS